MGKDHTLFALEEGHVRFAVRGRRTLKRPKRVVEVVPLSLQETPYIANTVAPKAEMA